MNKSQSFNIRGVNELLALIFFFTVASITLCHAYIDPGSTGALVTAILGFFAAIGYTFRKLFYKLRNAVFGSTRSDDDDE